MTVRGTVTPVTLKPAPETFIADMSRFAVPVLVITTVFVLVVPTVTAPNDSDEGEIVADTTG